MNGLRGPAIEFPPGFDQRRVLRPFRHSAWLQPGSGGRAYRVAITKHDPLAFMLTYLGHHMTQQDTGRQSLSVFHTDLAEHARRWRHPRPDRSIWVAPRAAGKTTLMFLGLPLWALAHGWRDFFLAFSFTAEQAVGHLGNLRRELAENELLRNDYPAMIPKRGAGNRNTLQTVVAGGATIAARGLGATVLGTRVGANRPDLIVGDDMEPDAKDYSDARKQGLESKLVNGIIPMGAPHAVIALTGTTVMAGSLIHDATRTAAGDPDAGRWVRAHRFGVHHYPPILRDGKSLWPQRWSVADLEREKRLDPHGYALNMENDPLAHDVGNYWTRDSFRYEPHRRVRSRLLSIDVATTTGQSADYSTLTVLGLSDDAHPVVVVEHSWAGRIRGPELLDRIHRLVDRHPTTLRRGIIEVNQGGELWVDILRPLPKGFTLCPYNARGHKADRIEAAFAHYARGAVVHGAKLPALEAQMIQYPDVRNDDLIDGLAAGLVDLLG